MGLERGWEERLFATLEKKRWSDDVRVSGSDREKGYVVVHGDDVRTGVIK